MISQKSSPPQPLLPALSKSVTGGRHPPNCSNPKPPLIWNTDPAKCGRAPATSCWHRRWSCSQTRSTSDGGTTFPPRHATLPHAFPSSTTRLGTVRFPPIANPPIRSPSSSTSIAPTAVSISSVLTGTYISFALAKISSFFLQDSRFFHRGNFTMKMALGVVGDVLSPSLQAVDWKHPYEGKGSSSLMM